MRRIVVGVDGSAGSRQALAWAVEEARLRGATLDVVHAWHEPYVGGYPYTLVSYDPGEWEASARELLRKVLAEVDTAGITVEKVVVHGLAARSLIEAAKGADLVVVGTRGLGGFSGLLLGSVSSHVVHHAPCPTVVVRPGE